jgi:hypothetical protein
MYFLHRWLLLESELMTKEAVQGGAVYPEVSVA